MDGVATRRVKVSLSVSSQQKHFNRDSIRFSSLNSLLKRRTHIFWASSLLCVSFQFDRVSADEETKDLNAKKATLSAIITAAQSDEISQTRSLIRHRRCSIRSAVNRRSSRPCCSFMNSAGCSRARVFMEQTFTRRCRNETVESILWSEKSALIRRSAFNLLVHRQGFLVRVNSDWSLSPLTAKMIWFSLSHLDWISTKIFSLHTLHKAFWSTVILTIMTLH